MPLACANWLIRYCLQVVKMKQTFSYKGAHLFCVFLLNLCSSFVGELTGLKRYEVKLCTAILAYFALERNN